MQAAEEGIFGVFAGEAIAGDVLPLDCGAAVCFGPHEGLIGSAPVCLQIVSDNCSFGMSIHGEYSRVRMSRRKDKMQLLSCICKHFHARGYSVLKNHAPLRINSIYLSR